MSHIVLHEGINAGRLLMRYAMDLGYTEQEIRYLIIHHGGDVLAAAREVGRDTYHQLRDYMANQDLNERGRLQAEGLRNGHNLGPSAGPHELVEHHRMQTRSQTKAIEAAVPTPSVNNSPPEATVPGNMQAVPQNGMKGGGETQIKPIQHVWSRFPNTDNAKLRWRMIQYLSNAFTTPTNVSRPPNDPFDDTHIGTTTSLLAGGGGALVTPTNTTLGLSTSQGYDFNTPLLIQLRMTCPYNIVKTLKTGGTTITTGNSQPRWLELFDQKYSYYHVLETDWEVTLRFGQPDNGTSDYSAIMEPFGYYVFWRYTNEDVPPTQQTFPNSGSTTTIANVSAPGTGEFITTTAMAFPPGAGTAVNLTSEDYKSMGGWHYKHITLNNTKANIHTIRGKYKFGQCKMDIKTITASDAHANPQTAEEWSLSGNTVPFAEDLSMIIVEDQAFNSVSGVLTPCSIEMATEQLIQFKDLNAAYKFPTDSYAQAAVSTAGIGQIQPLNTDIAFFRKGAAYT